MAPANLRLHRTDLRYGHVCPECAGPKTVQAARCWACHVDRCRAEADRVASSLPSYQRWVAA